MGTISNELLCKNSNITIPLDYYRYPLKKKCDKNVTSGGKPECSKKALENELKLRDVILLLLKLIEAGFINKWLHSFVSANRATVMIFHLLRWQLLEIVPQSYYTRNWRINYQIQKLQKQGLRLFIWKMIHWTGNNYAIEDRVDAPLKTRSDTWMISCNYKLRNLKRRVIRKSMIKLIHCWGLILFFHTCPGLPLTQVSYFDYNRLCWLNFVNL